MVVMMGKVFGSAALFQRPTIKEDCSGGIYARTASGINSLFYAGQIVLEFYFIF